MSQQEKLARDAAYIAWNEFLGESQIGDDDVARRYFVSGYMAAESALRAEVERLGRELKRYQNNYRHTWGEAN
jgi:hypothetical protein